MALFGLKKKDRVLDLTEKYKKQLDEATQRESNLETSPQQTQSEPQGFNFLGGMASAAKTSETNEESNPEGYGDERKKKLAKRLIDMTGKIEDLSNQIYHLQQRIEVLERKSGIRIE
jgi:prefoldin subunit 5